MNIWCFKYLKLRKQSVCMGISIIESDDSNSLFLTLNNMSSVDWWVRPQIDIP